MFRPQNVLRREPQSIQELQSCCRELATWARRSAEQLALGGSSDESARRFRVLAEALDRAVQIASAPAPLSDSGQASPWVLDSGEDPVASVPGAPDLPRTGLHGRSEDLPVEELLTFLAAQGKTGVLLVNSGAETFRIELVCGDVVHAASSHAPAGQRLGDLLVERGALTRQQLEAFLKTRGEDGSRANSLLGSALLDAELVSPDLLAKALTAQVQHVFRRLFVARRSTYSFHEGPSLPRGQRVRLNTTHLLLDGARERDESQRGGAAA